MKSTFSEVQRFNQWWLIVLIGVIIASITWFNYSEKAFDFLSLQSLTQYVILLVVMGFLFSMRLRTRVDAEGIAFTFFPIINKQRLYKWDEIVSVSVRTYKPLVEFGGWGIRFGMNRTTAYTTKGNKGIEIELKNGKRILLGTQQPEEAQASISHFA